MDLSKISDQEILSSMDRIVHNEFREVQAMLWHILEVEKRKLYLYDGYDSTLKYLTRRFGYSETTAYERINAAKVLKQAPEIAPKLQDGTLNLTQLANVERSLKEEKARGKPVTIEKTKDLLIQIENKTGYETKKILAEELDQPVQRDTKVKPQKNKTVKLELISTEEEYEYLKKIQKLVSHSVPNQKWPETFTYFAKVVEQKKEGKPAKSVAAKSGTRESAVAKSEAEISAVTQSFTETVVSKVNTKSAAKPKKRKYISIKLKRELMEKANHQCQYLHAKTGHKCDSNYQLQVDHIIPIARGGSDAPENLRVLCAQHNRHEARRWGLKRIRIRLK